MTIGQKIRKARERLGMSRSQFSRLTGISYGTLANYELDYYEPCLSYAAKIAEVLNVRLDYLARVDK